MFLQAASFIIQGEVWLRPLLCEGYYGEATPTYTGVQEAFWSGGTFGCQHSRPAGEFTNRT